MTIREMQQKFPSIPWVEYINTLLAPDMSIDEDEVVIVSVPNYIKAFEALISKTPKRYCKGVLPKFGFDLVFLGCKPIMCFGGRLVRQFRI